MGRQKLSAKDQAFEKERARFRRALREKEQENKDLAIENYRLRQKVKALERDLFLREEKEKGSKESEMDILSLIRKLQEALEKHGKTIIM